MEQNIRLKEKKSADEQIRLNKFLSDAGYCSRREDAGFWGRALLKFKGKHHWLGQNLP